MPASFRAFYPSMSDHTRIIALVCKLSLCGLWVLAGYPLPNGQIQKSWELARPVELRMLHFPDGIHWQVEA